EAEALVIHETRNGAGLACHQSILSREDLTTGRSERPWGRFRPTAQGSDPRHRARGRLEVEATRRTRPLAVLVLAPLCSLRLRLASLARLLVEPLATHILEHSGPNHLATELLQRPVQTIGFGQFDLYHGFPFTWHEVWAHPRDGSDVGPPEPSSER